jgi:hypothetical protein
MVEQNSYIFGFVDRNGDPYDFHISDDLQSKRTWESIDFKFSLPESKYIFVWKRDRTKFTRKEANYVFDYVKEDMDEYMDNVKFSNEKDTQSKITNILTPTKDCLIIAYDRIILPEGNINWKNYSDMISIYIDEMIEESIQGLNDSEQIENILEGKEPKNPILENFLSRTVRYEGFQKPSEKILVNIFELITNQNFENASLLLSGFYKITPPKIKIQTDLVNSNYVFYDVVNTTLFLDISKIPEFWQQLPSFFMGFFCHLSLMRNWTYGNPEESIIKEKTEAEKFCNECIQNLIRLNLDPRNE